MPSASLSAAEGGRLCDFARAVIGAELNGSAPPPLPEGIPAAGEVGSCFVTLYLSGKLRGCIGSVEAFEPLGENVRRNALNAAFRDPRFPPLAADEFEAAELELSVMGAPEAIASAEEFVPGKHGIILSLAGRRALFLPQVAAEQGWNRETTLDFLARKAGFDDDAWRRCDAQLFTFKTEAFSR